MSYTLNQKTREALLKAVSVLTGTATVLTLSGVLYLAPVAGAVAPADFGLVEGNTISASGSSDPDVYIINELGYKRLFLNPAIFGFYGHLGGFANVRSVSPSTRDAFITSGLFRNCETNDPKVYGVEVNGEDTAILHWVNTSGAQAVADDPNFFKKVFCINNNEFNWYTKGSDYTSVNQVPNYSRAGVSTTPSTSPGALSVSLSSNNPAASTTTTNAQGVEFMRFRLSGNGTVNSVTLKRTGAGSVDDFDNIYLYDGARRLVTGKTLSSSTGEATYNSLNIAVNGSKDISVVADLSATAGNVNAFQVNAIGLTSGTVSGLPISGNNMTVSGASSGTVTLSKVGSLGNPNAGQQDVQISEFKLAANTEAASVKRIQMLQGGTVRTADLTDLKIKTGTNEWSGSIDGAGYIVFDLGTGFTITKGGNAIFKVYADVLGKKDETVKIYFEYATDVLAIGDQYGYGMAVTLTEMDAVSEAHALTLQGGILTITSSGLSAANIGTDTDDTVFLRFTMAAASNLEIRKHRLIISIDEGGDGTFDDFVVAASTSVQDLDDVKIVNEATGQVLVGPADGSAFDEVGTASNNSGGTDEGAMNTFSDVIELSAGQTISAKITADVQTANTRTGSTLAADSKVAIGLQDYSDNVGVTEMKYSGTTTALAAADIVPNANVHGPTMTLVSSTLTLGLASNPPDQTVVKGSQNVDVVGINFQASTASALKVTDITVTGYSDADGTGAFDKGSAGDIGSIVASVMLVEKDSGVVLSSTPSANNLAAAAGTVVFNNLNWNIPAGATKTLVVRVNLLNLTPPTKDEFSFDIAATTDVTAVDSSGNSVNAGTATPNGATSITTETLVTGAGTIEVTEYDSSPSKDKQALYWGQTGAAVSAFRLRTTKEGFFINTFNLVSADSADAKNNTKNVYLEYQDKNGNTLVSTKQSLNSDASVSFGFSANSGTRPYIPKDASRVITVKIDTVDNHQNGATSNVDFAMNFSGGASNEFEAVGEGSFSVINGNDTTDDNTDSVTVTNKVLVYRSFPKFTNIVLPDGTATANAVVGKFTITAMGGDVLFNINPAASGTITFDTVASGQVASADPKFTLYDDATGQVLASETYDIDTVNASLSFSNFLNALSITGGQSRTLRVQGDLSGFNRQGSSTAGTAADHFMLVLQDEASVIKWVDAAGANADLDQANAAGYIKNLPFNGPNMTGQ